MVILFLVLSLSSLIYFRLFSLFHDCSSLNQVLKTFIFSMHKPLVRFELDHDAFNKFHEPIEKSQSLIKILKKLGFWVFDSNQAQILIRIILDIWKPEIFKKKLIRITFNTWFESSNSESPMPQLIRITLYTWFKSCNFFTFLS